MRKYSSGFLSFLHEQRGVKNGHEKKNTMDPTSVSFSLCFYSLFSFDAVDAVNGGTARGVGLTDGARKQREYSNYSSQFESSEMLQQSRTFALIKSLTY